MTVAHADLPEVLPHGELIEVLPDVFQVQGLMRMAIEPPRQFSRNMTVVREGDALVLLNSVRLDEAGTAALDALGTVTAIVKLGSFHGRDDAFYKARYPQAALWAPAGMPHGRGLVTDRELASGSLPLADASVFVYETPNNVESVLRLDRGGGALIPCDSLQNWETPDDYFDEPTREAMAPFYGRASIGFGWLMHNKPGRADFDRLLDLEFRHLLPSHGTPLLDDAHAALSETVGRVFAG